MLTRHGVCSFAAAMGTAGRSTLAPLFIYAVICAALLAPALARGPLPSSEPLDSEIPDFSAQTAPLLKAAISLPVAGILGAALAFRPRRRGTPQRTAMVIHTQILLALVGSIVMLVVGSSLARAFGIVGAAGLVRYRAKIDDPKDAGVMLASLAAGLASGSGLYLLASFATLFILLVLIGIESLGPGGYRLFELTVATKKPDLLSSGIEKVLRHNHADFELRSASSEEVSYQVKLPYDRTTDRVAGEILGLDQSNGTSVKWDEKKVKQLES